MRRCFVITFSIVNLSLWLSTPVRAVPEACHSTQRIQEAHCSTAMDASNPHWHSYTPRQRAIATAVAQIAATYYAQTAQLLPITRESVALVVNAIEAEPSDAAFVCDRMYAQNLAYASLDTADRVLQEIHQRLQTPALMCDM